MEVIIIRSERIVRTTISNITTTVEASATSENNNSKGSSSVIDDSNNDDHKNVEPVYHTCTTCPRRFWSAG